MSTGVTVPRDRVLHQKVTGFCRNPQCQEKSNEMFTFTVEHDNFSCPKCGANQSPMIGLFALIHLVIPDKAGPIFGQGGVRWAFGCDRKRAHLATPTNQEAVTSDPEQVNCPGCLQVAEKLGIRRALGTALVHTGEAPEPFSGPVSVAVPSGVPVNPPAAETEVDTGGGDSSE